jgi:hypothetical protein
MPVPSGSVWASATPADSCTCTRAPAGEAPLEAPGGAAGGGGVTPPGTPVGVRLPGCVEPGGKNTVPDEPGKGARPVADGAVADGEVVGEDGCRHLWSNSAVPNPA